MTLGDSVRLSAGSQRTGRGRDPQGHLEDHMPMIVVKMLEGRSVEQKRRLVKEMTAVVAKFTGATEEQVDVVIEDYPRENWAKGGVLFYDK